jgi:hypothetical protein
MSYEFGVMSFFKLETIETTISLTTNPLTTTKVMSYEFGVMSFFKLETLNQKPETTETTISLTH